MVFRVQYPGRIEHVRGLGDHNGRGGCRDNSHWGCKDGNGVHDDAYNYHDVFVSTEKIINSFAA